MRALALKIQCSHLICKLLIWLEYIAFIENLHFRQWIRFWFSIANLFAVDTCEMLLFRYISRKLTIINREYVNQTPFRNEVSWTLTCYSLEIRWLIVRNMIFQVSYYNFAFNINSLKVNKLCFQVCYWWILYTNTCPQF